MPNIAGFLVALVLAGFATQAGALIVAADLTGRPGVQTEALPPAGTVPLFPPSVDVFVGSEMEATIAADAGDLFNGIAALSTELELAGLIVTFDAPVFGLQFFGGLTDEFDVFLDGSVTFTVGLDTLDLPVSAAGPTAMGLMSDTAFTQATLTVQSFDLDPSAVAFLSASSVSATATPIPLPSSGPLLLSIAALFAAARRIRGRGLSV